MITFFLLRESLEAHPEPAAGPDISTIRFQLPKGTKLSRRFQKTDCAEVNADSSCSLDSCQFFLLSRYCSKRIFEFLSVHFYDTGDEVRRFTVSTHFPKLEITDPSLTIEALVNTKCLNDTDISCLFILFVFFQSLHPRGMLYVQDLDA